MNPLATGELDAGRAPVSYEDATQPNAATNFSAMPGNVCDETTGEARASANGHLRHTTGRKQRRNGMAKSFQPKIYFAQAIEKEESRAHGVIFEVACHKFEGRQRGYFEELPPML